MASWSRPVPAAQASGGYATVQFQSTRLSAGQIHLQPGHDLTRALQSPFCWPEFTKPGRPGPAPSGKYRQSCAGGKTVPGVHRIYRQPPIIRLHDPRVGVLLPGTSTCAGCIDTYGGTTVPAGTTFNNKEIKPVTCPQTCIRRIWRLRVEAPGQPPGWSVSKAGAE